MVIVEHADGRRYGVNMAAFHRIYEQEGFKIASNEDGSRYEPPAPKAKKDTDGKGEASHEQSGT